MKTLTRLFLALILLNSTSLYGQKDKLKNIFVNTNNEVIAVFKSGTVALFSNPDLKLIKEIRPGDKKNNAAMSTLSPSGNYIVVYDSKIKKWIFYDANNLDELNRLEKPGLGTTWTLPLFVKDDQFYTEQKIMNLSDLSVTMDISDHKNKHEGYAFSPSMKYYLNYEIDDTGGDGEFEVIESATGTSLGNSKTGDSSTESKYQITAETQFLNEDKIKIVYREFMGTGKYEWMVPTQMGVDNFDLKRTSDDFDSGSTLFINYQELRIVSGDYAIDASDDFSLYGMSAVHSASAGNEFVVVGTPKNKINLYENDSSQTEKLGEYKKSKLLTSIEIPKEK